MGRVVVTRAAEVVVVSVVVVVVVSSVVVVVVVGASVVVEVVVTGASVVVVVSFSPLQPTSPITPTTMIAAIRSAISFFIGSSPCVYYFLRYPALFIIISLLIKSVNRKEEILSFFEQII